MSDLYFDALRSCGAYPPKGFGWQTKREQKKMVKRYLEAGCIDEWVWREAMNMKIIKPIKYDDWRNDKTA